MLKRGKNATRESCEMICEANAYVICDENEGRGRCKPGGANVEVNVEDSDERGALAVADDERVGVDDRGDGGRSGRGRTVSAESHKPRVFLGNPAHRP